MKRLGRVFRDEKRPRFWHRAGGVGLDLVIVFTPLVSFSYIVQLIVDPGGVAISSIGGILYFVYLLLTPIFWNGYTLGKKILNIRIAKHDTLEAPGIGNMLLRVLVGRLIHAFTFEIARIVSCFMIALREDKRAIHDFVAGTVVVKANTSYMYPPQNIDFNNFSNNYPNNNSNNSSNRL